MIEKIQAEVEEELKEIRILTDDDVDSKQYCSYKIEIETSSRTIVVEGCHDLTPEVVEQ